MTARWLFGRRADRGRHTRGCGYGGPAAESGDGAAAEHLQYGPAGHRAPWAMARGSALTHHGRLPAAHGEGAELSRAATPPARHAACSTCIVPCRSPLLSQTEYSRYWGPLAVRSGASGLIAG